MSISLQTNPIIVSAASGNRFALPAQCFSRTLLFCLLVLLSAGVATCDFDEDGVPDRQDKCMLVADPGQDDSDADGFGDACDCDYDQDNICGYSDFGILLSCFGRVVGRGIGPPDDPNCEESDQDCNGTVGFGDFAYFIENFSGVNGRSGCVEYHPYCGMTAYSGDVHNHPSLALYKALEALEGYEPHAIGTVEAVLDAGRASDLDWMVLTPHSDGVNHWWAINYSIANNDPFILPDGEATWDEWAYYQAWCEDKNTDGSFLCFMGIEYTLPGLTYPRPGGGVGAAGHKLAMFNRYDLDRYCSDHPTNVGDCPTELEFFDWVKENDGFAIAAHPCGVGVADTDWSVYDSIVGAMEIKDSYCETQILTGWNAALGSWGHKIGAAGGSDTHKIKPGTSDRTICWAPALTGDDIMAAMKQHRCYWSDRYAPILEFSIDTKPMGSTLKRPPESPLLVTVSAKNTSEADAAGYRFQELEIVHNGIVVANSPCESAMACSFDSWVHEPPVTGYWYARITRTGGESYLASSPIWIELP